MEHIATIAKLLGSLFYYPVTHKNNQLMCHTLRQSEGWQESPFAPALVAIEQESAAQLADDFQLLFEGCDVMPAPPWGSVYLDREQVIFGESTIRFRHFLKDCQLALDTGMREPEDQFGLMLMALAKLADEQDGLSVDRLLQTHLLPWAYRYLTLVQEHARTQTYCLLADIARQWLQLVQEERGITAENLKVYF
ncbi:molecular chaperone TorD family protein [Photobacterium ganghwense]|uniref:molecular chaperone TorD family protein n=1 Tax=Photobacterium ganghwense TaxID=320778 RepID=UPI0039EE1FDE